MVFSSSCLTVLYFACSASTSFSSLAHYEARGQGQRLAHPHPRPAHVLREPTWLVKSLLLRSSASACKSFSPAALELCRKSRSLSSAVSTSDCSYASEVNCTRTSQTIPHFYCAYLQLLHLSVGRGSALLSHSKLLVYCLPSNTRSCCVSHVEHLTAAHRCSSYMPGVFHRDEMTRYYDNTPSAHP